MKTIILARVSDPREEGLSNDSQLKRAMTYCDWRKIEVRDEDIRDITESAWKKEREQFREILREVQLEKQPVRLICDRLDRLMRNTRDSDRILDLVKTGRLELHFVSDGRVYDQDMTSSDEIFWDVAVAMAKGESNRISERVKRNFLIAREQGRLTRPAPAFYRNVDIDGRKWVEPTEDAEYLCRAYELRREQKTYAEIRQILLKEGMKYFSKNMVERWLKNPFYGGYITYKGKIISEHQYERVVPYELWLAVQRIEKRRYRFHATSYAWTGKVKHSCGHTMSPYTSKGLVYLRCYHCTGTNLNEKYLIEAVCSLLNRLSPTHEQLAGVLRLWRKRLREQVSGSRSVLAKLTREQSEAKERIDQLLDLRLEKAIDQELFQQKLDSLREKLDNITKSKERLLVTKSPLLTIEKTFKLCSSAGRLFDVTSPEQRRALLHILVSEIEVGHKIRVNLKKPIQQFFDLMEESDDGGPTYRRPIHLGVSNIISIIPHQALHYGKIAELEPELNLLIQRFHELEVVDSQNTPI